MYHQYANGLISEGPGKRGHINCCGHIVARDVSWAAQTGKHLLRTQDVSEQNQKHFLCPDTKFVSATNVARSGKRGNICVGNNVSETKCPRLPGPKL